MMEVASNGSFGLGLVPRNENTNPETIGQLSAPSEGTPQAMFEELSDTEDVIGDDITYEDASSLLEPAISQTASRFKSSRTPAAERAMILEENGGYFDEEGLVNGDAYSSDENIRPVLEDVSPATPPKRQEMSLGKLPSPRITDPEIPITPWQAGPKDLQVHQQPSLQGVFGGRNRSLSNGADTLRKLLPKGLPSMAQIGGFLSSNSPTKSSFGLSLSPKVSRDATKLRKGEIRSQASSGDTSPRFESIVPSHSPTQPHPNHPVRSPLGRQGSLRRVNSDDSLLYHSLSRASSLGDDTRFENQREMVNSRMKAIRDSLQDRSSFRMPSIPSIPSMPRVPSFSFNMNFLNSSTPAMRSRANTDPAPGILSSNTTKKKPSESPTRSSTMTNAPATENFMPQRQRAATDHVRPTTNEQTTDILDSALEDLTGDVVIMGGYRGSILRSTKTNRQLWVPVKVGLNIRKVDLEVGLEPEDEENMHKKIYSSGMLQNIGPVDISKRLFKRLSECESARSGKLKVWDYGYDWRLSPHLLSQQLTKFMKELPSNQPGGSGALVIAHSLGGIITRHVVNHHPSLFSGVVYAGVPQSCVNILGPMRMGDAVLLSSRVLTAQVNFTFRTSFVLLPEDGQCFSNVHTKEKYPIDLFNVEDWIKYRLSPCTDQPLPPRNPPPPQTGLGSFLSLPISGRKAGVVDNNNKDFSPSSPTKTSRAADVIHKLDPQKDRTIGMQLDSSPSKSTTGTTSVSTHVTLPRPAVIAYLRRTLAETKKFKQELYYNPSIGSMNAYPPLALIYGKSIPTVSGAKVDSREAIPHVDCYDHLSFGSGDGVCLAKEAMLPEGYRVVKGGRINSDRGHVTLLGDLAAVGRAIQAVRRGRERGIGLGLDLVPGEEN